MATAFSIVMEESQAQVKEANDLLRTKKKTQLNHVISHHFCIILQNKAARYIKQLLESGVLAQREARHYLDPIEHQIIDIRHCPLDKHPGSIEFHELEEVKESMTRRKRVKQKSLL
jgi:polyhydroxyalkanoate synthesis regulator phasin